MIEIKECVVPGYETWYAAITGMRNSYRSWDKSDTFYCYGDDIQGMDLKQCKNCPHSCIDDRNPEEPEYDCLFNNIDGFGTTVLGINDKNLFLSLCKEGSSERKILRQLPVMLQLKAPLYLWKQIDQYKVSTVTNSESTMHSIAAKEFKESDFCMPVTEGMFIDYYLTEEPVISILDNYGEIVEPLDYIVFILNTYRRLYLETRDEKYKRAMIEILPESYYQSRMWSLNYEVIVNIAKDRIDHYLDEWRELILFFIDSIPYVKEILQALEIIKVDKIADKNAFSEKYQAYPTHTEVIQYWSKKKDQFELLTKRTQKGSGEWKVNEGLC